MNDVCATLVRAYALPSMDRPPEPLPPGSSCGITGRGIAEGHAVAEILKATSSEIPDLVCGPWVCDDAARCLEHWHGRGGKPASVLVVNGEAVPNVSVYAPSAAAPVRVQWPEALAHLRPGDEILAIVAFDAKKRIWPRARVGRAGTRTPILLASPDLDELRVVECDLSRLLEIVAEIESVLAQGAPKAALGSLLSGAWKADFAVKLAAESRVRPLRDEPEWPVALTIARTKPR